MLDTCMIFDIVRAPVREKIRINDIAAAHGLLMEADHSPRKIWLVITEQVNHEFSNHIDSVESETEEKLRSVTERIAKILKRMAAISPTQGIPDKIDLLSLGFPAAGRNDVKPEPHPIVIPAKAGIQWFMPHIPASAGMTI